jgi:hypothetical protein
VVETASPALEHVTFYQGGKAYGADLGPFKTPAREDDPRLSGFIPGDLRGHSRQSDSRAGSTPAAANEIFNITNGDYFRWQHMWPRIAKEFRMDVVEPVPIPLSIYMADKGSLWARWLGSMI